MNSIFEELVRVVFQMPTFSWKGGRLPPEWARSIGILRNRAMSAQQCPANRAVRAT